MGVNSFISAVVHAGATPFLSPQQPHTAAAGLFLTNEFNNQECEREKNSRKFCTSQLGCLSFSISAVWFTNQAEYDHLSNQSETELLHSGDKDNHETYLEVCIYC